METNFVHLHNHTEYSILDGACRVADIIDKAKELNMPAVAITDHGNMFGCIEFYQKAVAKGIKPIIGCELYLAQNSLHDRKTENGKKEAIYHITLLAKNYKGYENLLELVSVANLEGFYYKPRIDMELLKKHTEGLICLSGCLQGKIAQAVVKNKSDDEIRALAAEFKELFGEDFYLEVHNHFIPEEKMVRDYFINLSCEMGIELVAANDCHYTEKSDHKIHDILLCVQTGNTVDDENRMRFSSDDFYFKSAEEMAKLFPDMPEAISNTVKIAEKCTLELTFNNNLLPNYPMDDSAKTQTEYLRELCYKGLNEKYETVTEEAKERMEFELKTIENMGYVSYFLIVWDFINYARTQHIPVGPGRGSAAGSIVSYCLGITNLDPLKYALFFERFLNPDRVSMPDVDIDFCFDRRGEVIEYVYEKYTRSNVAQIVTFGRMKAKGLMRDVSRVLGVPYSEADKIAKLIPDELNIKLKDALDKEKELKALYDTDPKVKEIFDAGFRLEGLVRNVSMHAAGVVIAENPLVEHVPLFRGGNDDVVTQYEMKWLEEIGILKMDFLGLKTLTVIENSVKIIKQSQNIDIDLDNLPLDDKNAYDLLKTGNSNGIFQLESSGMQDLLRRSDPSQFTEIIDLIALYRPGPMQWLDEYIERKLGKKPITYMHPLLKPILENSFGIMIYQEQVMQAANVLANFTLAQADNLRRIMGKKKVDQMVHQKELFVKGAVENNIDKKNAEEIFDGMASFAEYGFNKSHSTAYALVSYQTAYLKANYPVEFMAALLSSELNNSDKITKYINEAKSMDIEVLPPDINDSFFDFTVKGKTIRFGLAAIKNVGNAAVENIVECKKEDGPFADLNDFIERIDSRVVNKKVLESLIKCGAFDSFGYFRSQLFDAVDGIIAQSQRIKKEKESNQISLFSMMGEQETQKMSDDIIKPQKEETWSKAEKLLYEKQLLGFYVTGHPLGEFASRIKKYSLDTVEGIKEAKEEKSIKAAGIIVTAKITVTKKTGAKMAILTIEDETENIDVLVFPKTYERCAERILKDVPVLIKGHVDTKDEQNKIIASNVLSLENLSSETLSLFKVKIAKHTFKEELLTLLKDYPADINDAENGCPLHFEVATESGQTLIMDAGMIDPSPALINKLESDFPETELNLVLQKQRPPRQFKPKNSNSDD